MPSPPETTAAALETLPPLIVDHADAVEWALQTDVLVVGFGAAGAATALEAHDGGCEVLLVDRYGQGGATARSGGVVYAGGGTPQQIEAGYEDTPEAMFRYLSQEAGDAVSPETLRRFCEDSRDLLAWLQGHGVEFRSHEQPPKTSYPKNGVYLYYSGNEAISGFREHAEPAPRGHRTVCKGLSGARLFREMAAAVARAGIAVRAPAAVRRLVRSSQGAVLGAELWELPAGSKALRRFRRLIARADAVHNALPGLADRWRRQATRIEQEQGQPRLVRARRGVVLSTGGFIFHREMLATHAPRYLANMRLGTSGCEGSGIRLGQSVGGSLGRMNKVSAWRFINPPTSWVEGMVVNADGERFCNEASYGARLGVAMCEEQGGRAWLILDRMQRRRAWREVFFGGLWIFQSLPAMLLMLMAPRANSLAALARRLDLPPDKLEATAAAYNAAARGEVQDPLGKQAPALQALQRPPFAALNISADNPSFPCPAITLGGLRVDEASGAVLDEAGAPIAGLYAAGRAAVGVASNGYVSGLSLADCFWSGRRAGRVLAAAETPASAAA